MAGLSNPRTSLLPFASTFLCRVEVEKSSSPMALSASPYTFGASFLCNATCSDVKSRSRNFGNRARASRCVHFRVSLHATLLQWRFSSRDGERGRSCWPCVENGRWQSGRLATMRSGSSVGPGDEEGVRSSLVAILNGYLMRELLPPLVLGTAAFTVLGVSIGVGPEVMALIEKLGFSFRHCLLYVRIVFLRLPTYVSLALPMASLLASMLAFGRLGVDSEVTAMRAAGIGSLRMLRPTFIVFLGITALHLLLAEGLAPHANQIVMDATKTAVASLSTVRDSGKSKTTRTSSAAFSRPVIYPEFRKHQLEHLLYAQGFDGLNSLLTVTFVQMEGFQDQEITTGNPQSKSNTALSVRRVVLAEEAIWDDVQGLWMFSNGCEYLLGKEDSQNKGSSLQAVRQFSSQYIAELTRTPLDFARLGVTKSFEDMTLFEAWSLLGLMKGSRNVKESRKLQVKIQQRLSLPFASLVFGLVGCLLSLHLPREQKRVGLALTLVIVFGYYIVSVFGSLIGQLGYVSPILGAWLPNLAGALLALVLFTLTL